MAKRATTIQEQIALLKSRGMSIPDEHKAEEVLLDIGFYRLGFYSFPFEKSFPNLNNRSHKYKPNTSFTDVLDLYYFDYDLRKILTYYLNRIEVNLRTYITYTISNHYKESPTWFVDSSVMKSNYIADFEDKVYKTIPKKAEVSNKGIVFNFFFSKYFDVKYILVIPTKIIMFLMFKSNGLYVAIKHLVNSIIPVMTRFKLNTCVPYIIRYPIPDLDVRNSP